MWEFILYIVLGILAYLVITRVVRRIYRFPIPHFVVPLIDNPIRLFFQSPKSTIEKHEIGSGMHVLEIGPGRGSYTLEAARQIGDKGMLVAIDISPQVINRLKKRIDKEGDKNIKLDVANAQELPFKDSVFDLVFMIAVLGEIPELEKAVGEIERVLKPSGILSITEILIDPDYTGFDKLVEQIENFGFKFISKSGNIFNYTAAFEKK